MSENIETSYLKEHVNDMLHKLYNYGKLKHYDPIHNMKELENMDKNILNVLLEAFKGEPMTDHIGHISEHLKKIIGNK